MAMMAEPEIHPPPPLAGRGVYLLDDHEVVRRGLRHLLESDGLSIAGESGSAHRAFRRIPALRPELVILDDDLPDGSGADVCRAIAAADPTIRCLLMTGDANEAVLIDSILAGAWGCLSKQDGSCEQLRLIRRALAGHTAYSGRFRTALVTPLVGPATQSLDRRLLTLTRQEMNTAIRLGERADQPPDQPGNVAGGKDREESDLNHSEETRHGEQDAGRRVHHQGAEFF